MSAAEKAPTDFPREPTLGGVSGVQPKSLLSKVDGQFLPDIDEEEVHRRWLVRIPVIVNTDSGRS